MSEKFSWPDQCLLIEVFAAMQLVQPALQLEDVIDSRVARLHYAQPVCAPSYFKCFHRLMQKLQVYRLPKLFSLS